MVFQKQQTTTAFKLAGGVDISASASKLGKQYPVASEFVTKINKVFLDSLYSMLNGLERLASDPAPELEQATSVAGIASAGDAAPQTASASANLLEMLDITDSVRPVLLSTSPLTWHHMKANRTLIVISNVGYLKRVQIPLMFAQLEAAFNINLEHDRQTLIAHVTELDKKLFHGFVAPKAALVCDRLRRGILDPAMDWYKTPPPRDVRPYMYETLMLLVGVHAQVTGVAPPLLERTFHAIIEELFATALRCFQQIPRLSMGGMLCVRLLRSLLDELMLKGVVFVRRRSRSNS